MRSFKGVENTVGQVGHIYFHHAEQVRLLIAISDYAQMGYMSIETVRRWIDEGKLIGIKVSGRWFVQMGEPIVVENSLDELPL